MGIKKYNVCSPRKEIINLKNLSFRDAVNKGWESQFFGLKIAIFPIGREYRYIYFPPSPIPCWILSKDYYIELVEFNSFIPLANIDSIVFALTTTIETLPRVWYEWIYSLEKSIKVFDVYQELAIIVPTSDEYGINIPFPTLEIKIILSIVSQEGTTNGFFVGIKPFNANQTETVLHITSLGSEHWIFLGFKNTYQFPSGSDLKITLPSFDTTLSIKNNSLSESLQARLLFQSWGVGGE